MLKEKYNADDIEVNVISSRIRLARNVSDLPFMITDPKVYRKLVLDVSKAVNRVEDFKLYKMSELDETERGAMVERYFISKKLYDNIDSGAVLVSYDEKISIMVNEEDQIREQCIDSGLKLKECYKRLSDLDNVLSRRLDFAFDERLGYLTACPSNIGTGLRASVMMFLPALAESGKLKPIMEEAEKAGMTFRGIYGEGSNADCYIYQISNEVTIGTSEERIVYNVQKFALSVSNEETRIRNEIFREKPIELKDKCKRAYGVLTNCVTLDYKEFLKLISLIKLGITLGIFNFKDNSVIDSLIINARENCLKMMKKTDLTEVEEGLVRAMYVSEKLKSITVG